MTRPKPDYYRSQTKWVRRPATIESHRHTDTIGIGIWPEHPAGQCPDEPALIFMTPHEAQGFAAWLSQQAEHLLAKQAKAAARRAATLVKKIGGEL
jgi:hypothetical protein